MGAQRGRRHARSLHQPPQRVLAGRSLDLGEAYQHGVSFLVYQRPTARPPHRFRRGFTKQRGRGLCGDLPRVPTPITHVAKGSLVGLKDHRPGSPIWCLAHRARRRDHAATIGLEIDTRPR